MGFEFWLLLTPRSNEIGLFIPVKFIKVKINP